MSDPAPMPDLDLDTLEPYQAVGGPIPDDGLVAELEAGAGQGEPSEQEDEEPERPEPVQASFTAGARRGVGPAGVASTLGAGRRIEPSVRHGMEKFFGHDFSRVRVYADADADGMARSLHARAFTVGEKIAFASGSYRPETSDGERLLTHELTHVVQQSRGLGGDILREGIGTPDDVYEQEAERNAARHARGELAATTVRSTQGVTTRPGTSRPGALQLYSGSAAASYARSWAKSTNPRFPRYGNDCTNFVSQATSAGGWPMTSGGCWSRKDDDVWWYGESRCWYPRVRSSFTWAGAHNFSKFVTASARGTLAARVADLEVGDVLQMAFSGTHINHSMVVTDKKNGDLYLSYHTSDHLDEPFFAPGGIYSRYPTANYYGWKL